MLARRIIELTIITVIISNTIGNLSAISELSFLTDLLPSSRGIASNLNIEAAASLTLSIIFCATATFIYSLVNKEDLIVAQVYEWYGCFIFGGALFFGFYWLTMNLWSTNFPAIKHGRIIPELYQLSLHSELWLAFSSFLLLLIGNFGLYLLAKIPILLCNPSLPSDTRN